MKTSRIHNTGFDTDPDPTFHFDPDSDIPCHCQYLYFSLKQYLYFSLNKLLIDSHCSFSKILIDSPPFSNMKCEIYFLSFLLLPLTEKENIKK
jgi:hypothetical protein